KILESKPVSDNYLEESRKAMDYVNRKMRNFKPGGILVATLQRIVDKCHDNNIQPILLGMPLAKIYRDNLTPQMMDAYYEFMHQFCEKNGCMFVDYQSALPDNLMRDHHHGTTEGCSVFSRHIATELLAPLLSGRTPKMDRWSPHASIRP